MSRKLKKGYFVRGEFVAEGSERDLELKAELKGTDDQSRTDLKRESTELQKLGEALLTLRIDLLERLELTDKFKDAIADAKRITNFEGKRRQMQYIGKLMRLLEPQVVETVRAAMDEQANGSNADQLLLHQAETWRDRLIDDEDAAAQWINLNPSTDVQQLRALIRVPPCVMAAPTARFFCWCVSNSPPFLTVNPTPRCSTLLLTPHEPTLRQSLSADQDWHRVGQ